MSAKFVASTYPKTNPYGKEVVKKSKGLRAFGIIFGIISVALFAVSMVLLFVLKTNFKTAGGETVTAGLLDYIVNYATGKTIVMSDELNGNGKVFQIVHAAITGVFILCSLLYLIVSIISMFKKRTQKKTNLSFTAGIVFAALWYMSVKELFNMGTFYYLGNIESIEPVKAGLIPFALAGYLTSAALILCSVYDVIKMYSNAGRFKEESKVALSTGRIVFLKIFALISTAALLVGLVMFAKIIGANTFKDDMNCKGYFDYATGSPLGMLAVAVFLFTMKVDGMTTGVCLQSLAEVLFMLATTLSIVYLAANLIMCILRLFVPNGYMRLSDYFDKYSVGNAVLRTATFVVLADFVMIVGKFMEMKDFSEITSLFTLDSLWDIILFGVSIVLAIIYTVVRNKDKNSYYENVVYGHFFETDGVLVKGNVVPEKPVSVAKTEKLKKGTKPPLTTDSDKGSLIEANGSPFSSL
ncbi:MAG: hypothetical protein HP008_06270 [Clostridia bacterium]|nr:hypothetical protein [Clostridia bacterium]